MKNETLLLLSFPVKVLFVDDDNDLLKFYSEAFKEDFNIQTIDSSEEALSLVNNQDIINYKLFTNDVNEAGSDLIYSGDDLARVNHLFQQIMKLADSKEKYKQVGVIISDYEMPKINGLKLCENINDPMIKKILLTGELGNEKAVKVLNNQKIQCYLEKTNSEILEEIKVYVKKYTNSYLEDITNLISMPLAEKLDFMKDLQYINLFNDIVTQNKIAEYYLINSNGSYLLINKAQEKFILLRHTDESLQEFCDFFDNHADVAELVAKVRNHELIPFFGINIDPIDTNLTDWEKHFYPANKAGKFYWSLIPLK